MGVTFCLVARVQVKVVNCSHEFNWGFVAENVLHSTDSIRPANITEKGQKQIYTNEVGQISFDM